jgi:hypothetical protein
MSITARKDKNNSVFPASHCYIKTKGGQEELLRMVPFLFFFFNANHIPLTTRFHSGIVCWSCLYTKVRVPSQPTFTLRQQALFNTEQARVRNHARPFDRDFGHQQSSIRTICSE